MIKLRPYQKEISDKACGLLRSYNIAYLAMEVRTGKTITALSAANKYNAKKVLFITKKKAIKSIENDYSKLNYFQTFKVTNYEQVHKLKDEYDFIIVDEIHNFGAYPKPSLRTKRLKKICKDKPIIMLTGTPTPESYSQIYHQLWISKFSPFKNYRNFYKWSYDYVIKKKKYVYNREINDYSHAREEKVKEAIKHLFITFTQKQAGFVQEINETLLTVKMNDSTYRLIDKVRKDRVYESIEGDILADTEVKLMQKCHQMFSGTVKTEDGNIIKFDNSKAKFIKHYFKGKKIAIFYKFIAEGEMLRDFFSYNTDSPEDFNNSDNKVFIGQIRSSREGVNLSTADALVFFNIDFSALSYLQGKERLQSKNRKRDAKVYWIFSKNGIEERIYNTVKNKLDYTLSYFKRDFK